MFKNRLAVFTLALGSLFSLGVPAVASAHDRDDWRNDNRHERRYSERERRLEERNARIARERYLREQALREQRYSSQYRYGSPYGNTARDGYYDRYGQWHSNPYPGYRY